MHDLHTLDLRILDEAPLPVPDHYQAGRSALALPDHQIVKDHLTSPPEQLSFRSPISAFISGRIFSAPTPTLVSHHIPCHRRSSQIGVRLSDIGIIEPLYVFDFRITRSPDRPITRCLDLHPKTSLVSLHSFPRIHSEYPRRRFPFHWFSPLLESAPIRAHQR